jgi:putative transcriptional regulator
MVEGAVGPGTFLIANPTLRDPNFLRSVVLLCEHNEKGSMGLIVNRPSEAKLADALSVKLPLSPEDRLFVGGPVQPDALLVLHRIAKTIPGAQPICDGIALGGDMQALMDLLGTPRNSKDKVRVYAGYSGWGAGQLDQELEAGGWITCSAEARFIFDFDPSQVWVEVLRSLGDEYVHLTTVPLDPRVN